MSSNMVKAPPTVYASAVVIDLPGFQHAHVDEINYFVVTYDWPAPGMAMVESLNSAGLMLTRMYVPASRLFVDERKR